MKKIKHYGLLSDTEIRRLALEETMITPFAEGEKRSGIISFGLSHAGYDMRLGNKFTFPIDGSIIDPKRLLSGSSNNEVSDACVIPPNSRVLCETVEVFRIPSDIITVCFGKSTYARLGLIVNVTPFEPGWVGKPTITLINPTDIPIRVYANEGIAQLLFYRLHQRPEVTYADKDGKYQNQEGVTHSRVD